LTFVTFTARPKPAGFLLIEYPPHMEDAMTKKIKSALQAMLVAAGFAAYLAYALWAMGPVP
jgi:hypothetical protein